MTEPESFEEFQTEEVRALIIKDPLSPLFAPAVAVGNPQPGEHTALLLVHREASTDSRLALQAANRHALMIDEP
jgi:hypothetical protein